MQRNQISKRWSGFQFKKLFWQSAYFSRVEEMCRDFLDTSFAKTSLINEIRLDTMPHMQLIVKFQQPI